MQTFDPPRSRPVVFSSRPRLALRSPRPRRGAFIRRAVPALLALVGMLAPLSPALGQPAGSPVDWPMLRHDPRQTGFSPGKAKLAKPALAWRIFLGGGPAQAQGVDVDYDGRDEVVAVEAGVVSARTWSGQVIWKTAPLGVNAIVAVRDVTGDALPEVVCRTASAAVVLSAATGDTLWASPPELTPKLRGVFVVDVDGDGTPEIATADRGGYLSDAPGHVYVHRLLGAKASLLYKSPAVAPNGALLGGDQVRWADVDGDGLPDLIRAAHSSLLKGVLWAWSGKTGKLVGQTEVMDRVECRIPVALPGAAGVPPLVLCTTYVGMLAGGLSMRGAWAMRLEAGVLVRKWKYVVPDEEQDRFEVLRVADFDGDGQIELLASEQRGGVWRLVALDALDGHVLTTQLASGLSAGAKHVKAFGAHRLSKSGPLLALARISSGSVAGLGGVSVLLRWKRATGFSVFASLGQGVATAVPAPAPPAGLPAGAPSCRTLGAAKAGVADFLLRRDTDGDGRVDLVARLQVTSGAKVTALDKRSFALPPGVSTWLDDGPQRRALLVTSDGQAAVVGPGLKTLNDGDGDGDADLIYGGANGPHLVSGRAKAKDSHPLLVAGLSGRLLLLDPSGAGPLAAPKVLQTVHGGGGLRGSLTDLDGDGEAELLVRDRPASTTATMRAFSLGGSLKWTYDHGGKSAYFMAYNGETLLHVDVDGDGGADVLVGYHSQSGAPLDAGQLIVVSGATGKPLWAADAPCRHLPRALTGALDLLGAAPVMVSSYSRVRVRCRLGDGALLSSVDTKGAKGGLAMLADLDGKPGYELVLGGPLGGLVAETVPAFKPLWKQPGSLWQRRPAALVFGKGPTLLVTTVHGPPLLEAREAATGKLKWARHYAGGKAWDKAPGGGAPPSLGGIVAVADLAGDGEPGLLFHGSDGWLYAARASDGKPYWAMPFGGVVGDPILVDLDADGELELVLASPDGYLHAYDSDVLGAVAWVRENGGQGPALTQEQDIDQQEDASRLHLNWPALPGAQGYAVEVRRKDGGAILPLVHVGSKISVTLDGLHLQPGVTYVSTVRGWSDADGVRKYSLPASSDGLRVVDVTGPVISGFRADPASVTWEAPATTLRATVTDATRVVRLRIEVWPFQGAGAVHAEELHRASATVALHHPYALVDALGATLPAGRYIATLRAWDSAGHEAAAATGLTLCAQGRVATGGDCVGTDAPDAGGSADAVVGGDVAVDAQGVEAEIHGDDTGCGCRASGRGKAPDGWMLLWTVLLLAVVRLGRRRGSPTS